MKTLSRFSTIALVLLALPAAADELKQFDDVTETVQDGAPATEGVEDAVEGAVDAFEDAEDVLEEIADSDEDVESDDDDDDTDNTIPAEAEGFRNLNRASFETLVFETGFDADAIAACGEEQEVRRRERAVTRRVPFTLYVLADGGVRAEFTGEDDDEGSIAECVDGAVSDMELEDAPESVRESKYRYIWYDSTFYPRRRMRHAEIIALYTLSGVSAGVGVGAFIAARNDDAEADARLAETPSSDEEAATVARQNAMERPDRFRAAGWAMVGVSVASFVGASLLHTSNRNIERRENPILVLSPGSPTGDLGFTLSGQF